jgi:hypothetical protein
MSFPYKLPSIDEFNENAFAAPVILETGYSKIVVVENTPIAPNEKFAKLKQFLTQTFQSFGSVVDVCLPQNQRGDTEG